MHPRLVLGRGWYHRRHAHTTANGAIVIEIAIIAFTHSFAVVIDDAG